MRGMTGEAGGGAGQEAIEAWFEKSDRSPKTNEALQTKQLVGVLPAEGCVLVKVRRFRWRGCPHARAQRAAGRGAASEHGGSGAEGGWGAGRGEGAESHAAGHHQ